jgi:hypothetical protein
MELHGVLYGVARTVRHERTEHLLKLFDLWIARTIPGRTIDRRSSFSSTEAFVFQKKILCVLCG